MVLDGAFCQPEQVTEITLAPAQRADVIVDMDRGSIEIAEISTGEPYPAATVLVDPALGPSSLSKTPINTPKPAALPPLNNLRRIPIHMQGGAMGNLQKAMFEGEKLSLRELAQKHKKRWAFNGQIGDYSTIVAGIDQNDLV